MDGSGTLSAADALRTLKAAVGQPIELLCQCSGESSGATSPPLKTGQTDCWYYNGQIWPCAGMGQDGELQKGTPRSFTDNGNGTITDNASGLMWEKLSNDESIHDYGAIYEGRDAWQKIAQLNTTQFAGYGDWRLPNINELLTLVNYGSGRGGNDYLPPGTFAVFNEGCTFGCTVKTCSCTNPARYWSSTTYHYRSTGPLTPTTAETWVVDFWDGRTAWSTKTFTAAIRAVRGGS